MNYHNHTDGIVPIGKFLLAIVVEDEFDNDRSANAEPDDYPYLASEECIRKMRQRVACNDFASLHTADARTTLVSLCWYFEPAEAEPDDCWNEAAIRKMRESTVHGVPVILNRASLERLAHAL